MQTKSRLLPLAAAVTLAVAACGPGTKSTSGQAPAAVIGQPAGQAGSAAASGSAGGGPGRRFATISVQAVTVKSGPLISRNDTAGIVMPVMQSNVAAQVAGVVSKVLHRAGEFVSEGTPVVQLDDSAFALSARNAQAALDNAKINLTMGKQTATGSGPKLQSQLEAAQVSLAAAQKTYESQKALYNLGGISAAQLDNAQSALAQAQANVQAAQLALDQNSQSGTQNIAQLELAVDQAANQLAIAQLSLRNATVKAPFTGQIAAVNVNPGAFVGTNTTVFVLVSGDKQINFSEPPTDAPNFRIGDAVQFTYNGKSYPVRIVQTPSAPINGMVPMVASVPAGLPVSYGAVGTVTYLLTVAAGPQIPIAAMQSRANINYVDAVVNNKAVEVPIVIVAEAGSTAVVQGLHDGDQVIINPPPGLLNGSTVQVVAAPAAAGQQGTGAAPGPGGAQGRPAGQAGPRQGSGGQRSGSTPTQPPAGGTQ